VLTEQAMRILVLGAGATGGYFGGRLVEAGADVTFLVRPKRAQYLAEHGLPILSPAGDVRVPAKTVLADTLEPGYDLVILSCKAYDLDSAIAAIRPAMGPETRVLPLLNGMRHLDALDAAFGSAQVLGGTAQIGATLTPEGEVRHMGKFHLLTFGERLPAQANFCGHVARAMEKAKFDSRHSPRIMQDMWEKFVMITVVAGMTTLMRGALGDIVAARHGPELVTATLAECAKVAEASGHRLDQRTLAGLAAWLTEKGSTFSSSMLRDTERRGPIEADHIVGDMLARAEGARIPAPMLRVIYAHLQTYEARRRREAW
jgi:2-dehydropantoate 2-reductase